MEYEKGFHGIRGFHRFPRIDLSVSLPMPSGQVKKWMVLDI